MIVNEVSYVFSFKPFNKTNPENPVKPDIFAQPIEMWTNFPNVFLNLVLIFRAGAGPPVGNPHRRSRSEGVHERTPWERLQTRPTGRPSASGPPPQ